MDKGKTTSKLTKMDGSPRKSAAGRPPGYKDEYCQRLIDIMENGDHVCHFCAEITICKDTFYEWVKKIPKFADAYKKARIKAEAWWVTAGKDGMFMGKKFNPAVFMINMRNRFDWNNHKDTYRKEKIEDFDGSIKNRVDAINKKRKNGEIAPDVHATTMKALKDEAEIIKTTDHEDRLKQLESNAGISNNS